MFRASLYLLAGFIGAIAGNLIAAWIQKDRWRNVFSRPRLLATGAVATAAIVVMVFLERPSEPTLYILEQRDRPDTFLVAGTAVGSYQSGDGLVVYDESIPDVEEPVALMSIVAVNPNSLVAQVVLHNPERPIRTRFRVDDEVEQVSRGELVPYEAAFVAYYMDKGRIRIRPGSVLAPNILLQAYEPVVLDGLTLDYVKASPATQLRVSDVGVQQAIAVTTLAEGAWPQVGTVLAVVEEVVPVETAVPTTPNQPTTTSPPEEETYSGPCRLESLEAVPPSPQVVGTAVTVRIRGDCETGVRAIRLLINGEWVGEKGGHIAPPEEFSHFWLTDGLEAGEYVLTAEVATWGDDDWQFVSSQTTTYTLTERDENSDTAFTDWVELIGPSNNGDFETGDMSLWSIGEGVFELSSEESHSGNFAVRGTSAVEGWFYRDVSIEAYRSQVDQGLGVLAYGAWFQSGSNEQFRLIIRFIDASGAEIANEYNTGWLVSSSADDWKYEEGTLAIPSSTEKIRVELHVRREREDFTDVDIDDVTLRVNFVQTSP